MAKLIITLYYYLFAIINVLLLLLFQEVINIGYMVINMIMCMLSLPGLSGYLPIHPMTYIAAQRTRKDAAAKMAAAEENTEKSNDGNS